MTPVRTFFLIPLLFTSLPAISVAQGPPSVQAVGTATLSVTPDQAQLTIGVVTQATTAQDAASQNAVQTQAVITALQKLLPPGEQPTTVGYTVNPRYNNASPAAIVGYTASNTLQVTTSNLNLAGPLIDAANAAGANSISGVTYGLHDPEPVTLQVLGLAAKKAIAHATAIATGLGGRVGPVRFAQEGASYSPVTGAPGIASGSTPILTGTVSVSATVTVNVQLQ